MAVGNVQAPSLSVEHKDIEFVEQSNTLALTYHEQVMQTMTFTHV